MDMLKVVIGKAGFIIVRVGIIVSLVESLAFLVAHEVLLAELTDNDLFGVSANEFIEVF